MKKIALLLIVFAVCFARMPNKVNAIDGETVNKIPHTPYMDRGFVTDIGDIRALLGPQGKNIEVSANGDAIALIYGGPTGDPNDFMEVKVAYSLDQGATWTHYGPFSAFMRRIYPGVDGSPDFDVNGGELYFTWQESEMGYAEGDHKIMIEEGTPDAPSFSSPASLPSSSGEIMCPWFTCVAVDPDDPYNVAAASFSYLNNGNTSEYVWVSDDGGYTFTDSIYVYHAFDPISGSSGAGHLRRGPGGYMFFTFHDTVDIGIPVAYPFIIESTNYGNTWGPKQELNVPIIGLDAQFWWTELDCEYIDGNIWTVHKDINQVWPDSGRFWVHKGTGSPGSWTWEIWDVDAMVLETTIADTSFYFEAGQYPSISYDPVSGCILVAAKCFYEKIYTPGPDTIYSGAHVGGVYTYDNGATWHVTAPLSDANTGQHIYGNWSATEVAHRLVNDGGTVYAYSTWCDEPLLQMFFEKGEIKRFTGINEIEGGMVSFGYNLCPNITHDRAQATFNMPVAGAVALNVYDATGRLIETVYQGRLAQGSASFDVNVQQLASGTYFVVLETEHGVETEKLVKLH
jgi:hypothetical protein